MGRKLKAASDELQASIREPKASSFRLYAWDYELKSECKSLRLAFELETHLQIIQQQRWSQKDKIETCLTLTNEERKMLTTFINKL